MSDREDVRELLRELLKETIANGEATVPPAPVAAVLRPSTWSRAPAPGEVIGESPGGDSLASSLREHRGDGATTSPARTEHVRIESDADLDAFVRSVLDQGDAIREGRLRFTLGRGTSPASGVMRVEHGAVTERTIKKAADAGARLVLGPGAVLTPLARDKARALGIEIERERRC